MLGILKKLFGTSQERIVARFKHTVKEVNHFEKKFQSLSDDELKAKTVEFKKRISEGESVDALLPEAYAVVKSACARMCGTDIHVSGYDQKWDMVPYDVQIIGATALHHGHIAEMQTGEGKTLTAIMPLYLNALTGKPVHLVTVNDYLVQRDCAWAGSVLRWLGLTTGVIVNGTDQKERRELYKCDVLYGSASEFGFDYLRDNSMAGRKEEQVQRGYYFAIVDEIDSILIDEARTPLIISGPTTKSMQMYDELKDSVAQLVKLERDLCTRISTEAKKTLEKWFSADQLPDDKKELEKIKDACKRLWLVGKGMPNNKVLRRAKENPDLRSEIDKWDLYFHSDQTKEEKADTLAELFMVIDERGNEFELTDKGITAWSEVRGESGDDFVMLDLGHEYALVDSNPDLDDEQKLEQKLALNEDDVKRKERAHNLRQLLRAQLLMEKDIDYIIDQGKIVIIDENTGRPQPGRRFSDGLHQAIEAKEGLKVQKETQTYASITLQNYFRMYEKLAGMTGTAITEAGEFKEIYKLEVLQIPTYKPCVRTDAHDEIYMTEREKYHAILKDIKEVHEKGRPILLGTESVDVSEKLSRILRQNQIPHTVLNAKHHASEAEIIANAGEHGAVTVATNMAGRGTDIKLKNDVSSIGGLHVIGTTRHQSRRIDRQLRGRSARLGDPGSSKFYISFEDPLMRLFASPKLNTLIQRFRPPEGEPISAGILNRSIQTAQKRVEGRNYMMRKYTIEYDDVMNKQRHEVYNFRNEILQAETIIPHVHDLFLGILQTQIDHFFRTKAEANGWNPEGFRLWLVSTFPVTFEEGAFDDDHITIEEIEKISYDQILTAFEQKYNSEKEKAIELGYDGDAVAQDAIRSVIMHKIDELWQEHLLIMDNLRSEVNLRAVAQRDPLQEFKHEAFTLFNALSKQLQTEAAKNVFRVEIAAPRDSLFQEMLKEINLESNKLMFDEQPAAVDLPAKALPTSASQPTQALPKIGRNDPCPCKSGKKYKRCCGISEEVTH